TVTFSAASIRQLQRVGSSVTPTTVIVIFLRRRDVMNSAVYWRQARSPLRLWKQTLPFFSSQQSRSIRIGITTPPFHCCAGAMPRLGQQALQAEAMSRHPPACVEIYPP